MIYEYFSLARVDLLDIASVSKYPAIGLPNKQAVWGFDSFPPRRVLDVPVDHPLPAGVLAGHLGGSRLASRRALGLGAARRAGGLACPIS